ncbi:MAG: arsenate reductase ArsC, partial [Acidimicrobiales bacterium]
EVHRFNDLPPDEKLLIRRALEVLKDEFHGIFDDETIESFLMDSFDRLLARAKARTFLGIFAERFARERLTAMAHIQGATPGRPGVLFLCVHNAGRSQMAAGWLRSIAGDKVDVYTGGSEPSAELNPVAVVAMAEVGIDIREEFPKPWTDEVVRAVDVIIAMGCGDACPVYPGKRYLEWELDDPEGKDLDDVRQIRDELHSRVESLIGELSHH